jgi:hypothetical protein
VNSPRAIRDSVIDWRHAVDRVFENDGRQSPLDIAHTEFGDIIERTERRLSRDVLSRICDLDLSPDEHRVVLYVIAYTAINRAYPSVAVIVRDLGVTESTVQSAHRKLCALGARHPA